MKKKIWILVALLVVCFVPSAVFAEEGTTSSSEGIETLGTDMDSGEVLESTDEPADSSSSEETMDTTETTESTESTTASSETTESTQEEKVETLEALDWTYYASTELNQQLPATAFIPMIETLHSLSVDTISYTNNSNPDTSKVGTYSVDILFTTVAGKKYQAHVNYFVKNDKPTIEIKNIVFDVKRNTISFTTSPGVIVYMTADTEPATWECGPDKNGYYEAELRSKPNRISLIALDLNGNYSDEIHLMISRKDEEVKIPLNSIGYDYETNTLSGNSDSNIDVTVIPNDDTSQSQTGKTGADGNFSFTFTEVPKTIRIELTNEAGDKEVYYFNTTPIDQKDADELTKDAKKLPHTGESNTWMYLSAAGAIILAGLLFIFFKRRKNSVK